MTTKLTLTDNGVTYSVWFDRWDALQPERAWWCYSISGPFHEVTGSDLSTVGDDAPYAPALETLLAFLGAFLESGPAGENGRLFPAHLHDHLDYDDVTMLQLAILGDHD